MSVRNLNKTHWINELPSWTFAVAILLSVAHFLSGVNSMCVESSQEVLSTTLGQNMMVGKPVAEESYSHQSRQEAEMWKCQCLLAFFFFLLFLLGPQPMRCCLPYSGRVFSYQPLLPGNILNSDSKRCALPVSQVILKISSWLLRCESENHSQLSVFNMVPLLWRLWIL